MRVALLGCIHGNLAALEAVLDDATRAGVQRIVCAGDVVGWGPQPAECLALLRSRGIPSIRGHDDRRVVDLALDRERGEDRRGAATTEWAIAHLAAEDVRTLGSMPLSYGFTATGRTVVVVHGTPREEDEHLLPDAPERRLDAFLLIAGADVLACAHGHRPFVRVLEDKRPDRAPPEPGRADLAPLRPGRMVVNVGSVGRSFDGDPRAAWVLLELAPHEPPRAEIRRVAYDPSSTRAAAAEARAPRRVREELAARARGLALGEVARGLVVTAPFRGSRTLERLARRTIRGAVRGMISASEPGRDLVEATHDLRVAGRRLLSALSVFADLVPADVREAIVPEVTKVLKQLSEARDADVALELLAASPGDGSGALARDAALESLGAARALAETSRVAALSRARRKSFRLGLRALAARVARRGARTVGERLSELASDARERLARALAPGADDEAVHRFRVGVKRLRYGLEPFGPIDPATAALAHALAVVQQRLGDAHDRSCLALRLDTEVARLLVSGRTTLAATVALLADGFKAEADAAIAAFRREGPGPAVLLALELGDEERVELEPQEPAESGSDSEGSSEADAEAEPDSDEADEAEVESLDDTALAASPRDDEDEDPAERE